MAKCGGGLRSGSVDGDRMGLALGADGQHGTTATGRGQALASDRAHAPEILALVEERPDLTLSEIAAHLEQAHGLRVCRQRWTHLIAVDTATPKRSAALRRVIPPSTAAITRCRKSPERGLVMQAGLLHQPAF